MASYDRLCPKVVEHHVRTEEESTLLQPRCSNKEDNQVLEENTDQANNSQNPFAPGNPLTLQIRKRGASGFLQNLSTKI